MRLGLGGRKYAAKQTVGFGFTLRAGAPIALEHDSELTLTAGRDWIPLKTMLDIEPGSALDFSNQNLAEAPAGKYGRVICRDDGQFVFENERNTPRRFYGVNFCFGAQYLTHEQADTVADRLARIGYNAVRIHHYEGLLTEGQADSTQLNEKRLEQLDYFLAALGKRGIYITTDLFVSRPIKFSDIGIDKPGFVPGDDFKIMVPVVPKAFENWKKFARALLEHVNPYTQKRYADDPALAWLSMINEGCFGNFTEGMKHFPEWKTLWNQWLAQRYPTRDKLAEAWGKLLKDGEDPAQGTVASPDSVYGGNARARDVCLFLAEKERAMVVTMKDLPAQRSALRRADHQFKRVDQHGDRSVQARNLRLHRRSLLRRSPAVHPAPVEPAEQVRQHESNSQRRDRWPGVLIHAHLWQAVHDHRIQLRRAGALSRRRRNFDRRDGRAAGLVGHLALCVRARRALSFSRPRNWTTST